MSMLPGERRLVLRDYGFTDVDRMVRLVDEPPTTRGRAPCYDPETRDWVQYPYDVQAVWRHDRTLFGWEYTIHVYRGPKGDLGFITEPGPAMRYRAR